MRQTAWVRAHARGHDKLLSSGPWLIGTRGWEESVPQSRSRVARKVPTRPPNSTLLPRNSYPDRWFKYGACSRKLAQYNEHETTKQLRNMQAMCPPVLQHNFLFGSSSTSICKPLAGNEKWVSYQWTILVWKPQWKKSLTRLDSDSGRRIFRSYVTMFADLCTLLSFLCICTKTEFAMWTEVIVSVNWLHNEEFHNTSFSRNINTVIKLINNRCEQNMQYVGWLAGRLIYSCCSHFEHGTSVKLFVSLQFLNLRHSIGLLGRVNNPSQGRYLTQNIE
jgi:hypothetical protein